MLPFVLSEDFVSPWVLGGCGAEVSLLADCWGFGAGSVSAVTPLGSAISLFV